MRRHALLIIDWLVHLGSISPYFFISLAALCLYILGHVVFFNLILKNQILTIDSPAYATFEGMLRGSILCVKNWYFC